MNNIISETLKELTICTIVLIFSFILLAPTADALGYDPKKRQMIIIPDGDTDPWEEQDVIEPPPDDNTDPENDLFTYKDNINIIIISFNSIFGLNLSLFSNDISSDKLTSRKSDRVNRKITDRQ